MTIHRVLVAISTCLLTASTVVGAPNQENAARRGVHALFVLVEVSSERLEQIAALIEAAN